MKNFDYSLLVQAERIRFQSDFSSSHWLFQVLCQYETQNMNPLRRGAYEQVIRCAINCGVKEAVKLAATFPESAGFPDYLQLDSPENWPKTCKKILDNFGEHEFNRFKYAREGD